MHRLPRSVAALALGLAGAALVVVPARPAGAAACSGSSGVTVEVDFAALGGGAQVRCAPGDPSSGVAALTGAGFTPTRAAQEPGYFVCRIDGKPASDPCQRASPSNAYWSYWHARPGGSWTYSSAGAADYDPAPGTVEGWAFGAGKPPSTPPPAAAASAPSPAPTPAAASPAPRRKAVPWQKAAGPARVAASRAAARSAAPVQTAASPSGAGAVSTPSPVASSGSPSAEASAAPAAADRRSPGGGGAGSLVGALVAGVLVLALGGAALVRRRRGA